MQGSNLGWGFRALSQEELLCGGEEDIRRKEKFSNLDFLGSNQKQKCIIARKDKVRLVLGEDMSMEKIIALMEKSLIERFMGIEVSEGSLHLWMEKVWY
jgi:hypothetical protein